MVFYSRQAFLSNLLLASMLRHIRSFDVMRAFAPAQASLKVLSADSATNHSNSLSRVHTLDAKVVSKVLEVWRDDKGFFEMESFGDITGPSPLKQDSKSWRLKLISTLQNRWCELSCSYCDRPTPRDVQSEADSKCVKYWQGLECKLPLACQNRVICVKPHSYPDIGNTGRNVSIRDT